MNLGRCQPSPRARSRSVVRSIHAPHLGRVQWVDHRDAGNPAHSACAGFGGGYSIAPRLVCCEPATDDRMNDTGCILLETHPRRTRAKSARTWCCWMEPAPVCVWCAVLACCVRDKLCVHACNGPGVQLISSARRRRGCCFGVMARLDHRTLTGSHHPAHRQEARTTAGGAGGVAGIGGWALLFLPALL